jgi:hypothetical protein
VQTHSPAKFYAEGNQVGDEGVLLRRIAARAGYIKASSSSSGTIAVPVASASSPEMSVPWLFCAHLSSLSPASDASSPPGKVRATWGQEAGDRMEGLWTLLYGWLRVTLHMFPQPIGKSKKLLLDLGQEGTQEALDST